MTEKWAFTIKYNPNDLTEDEYKQKIDQLMKFWEENKVNIIHYRFENQDKQGRQTKMHCHGTCQISRGVYRKKLMKTNYHVKLVSSPDANWTKYTEKNVKVKIIPLRSQSPPLPPMTRRLM